MGVHLSHGRASLSRAHISLTGVHLSHGRVSLTGVLISHTGVHLSWACISLAACISLTGVYLSRACISLTGVHLSHGRASLTGVHVTGVHVTGAHLSQPVSFLQASTEVWAKSMCAASKVTQVAHLISSSQPCSSGCESACVLGGFPRNNHPGLTRNKLLAAHILLAHISVEVAQTRYDTLTDRLHRGSNANQ